MAYRVVAGEALGTTWDDAPIVRVVNRPAGNPTDVVIEYVSAPNRKSTTRITFSNVIEYHWVDCDYDRVGPNAGDYEFGLIEIVDSEFIARIIATSPYSDAPAGDRLGGVLSEVDLRHYRIGFDEHGTYDVVCTGMVTDVAAY